MRSQTTAASLPEVHSSVVTAKPTLIKRMLAFAGPAYLVSVGYMDPGNWASDLAGGSSFGYRLLWVVVLSNFMAILLQTLAARLGIVAGRDLAQACREAYPKPVCRALWVLCEIAIAACDLAEVLGAAIGLKILFGLPLLAGVILTAADTILVLWLSRFGIRVIEAAILSLIAIMTGCFLVELFLAHPQLHEVLSGLAPRLDNKSLYIAVTIVGATVMPHNLYLHSALVQTRRIGRSSAERREACRFNLLDSVIALNGALIVNAAILVLAAAVFFKHGVIVSEIEQAHVMLAPLLGTTLASVLFAVALLASGQSSTLTGTYAGQIVMEGFLDLRMRPWMRRLITRTLAIIPAVAVISLYGEQSTLWLLLLSQAIISMQLPFAVIPLVRFTDDKRRMGEFANRTWVKLLAWSTAVVILALNLWLMVDSAAPWLKGSPWRSIAMTPLAAGFLALLGLDHFFERASGAAAGAKCRRSRGRFAGSGISQDSGASRSQLARPCGDRARRISGPSAQRDAAPAACGRRRHQPVVRPDRFGRGGACRRTVFPRDCGLASAAGHRRRAYRRPWPPAQGRDCQAGAAASARSDCHGRARASGREGPDLRQHN